MIDVKVVKDTLPRGRPFSWRPVGQNGHARLHLLVTSMVSLYGRESRRVRPKRISTLLRIPFKRRRHVRLGFLSNIRRGGGGASLVRARVISRTLLLCR